MSELNLPEVPVEEKEKFFDSVRNRLAMIVLAIVGVVAWFSGIFPEFQAPVIDLEVANVFVNCVAAIVSFWIVGRSLRNSPTGNGNSIMLLVSELLAMLVSANKKPFPQEED